MTRNNLILSYSLLLVFSGACYCQNVTITGKADSSYLTSANTVYAYCYDDLISYSEKELGNTKLDTKGHFNLSFQIPATTNLFLMIDNARAEMVVEPGKTYEIILLAKDSDAINTLSIAVPVGIEFRNSNETELNYLIADFTSRYEAFLEDHQGIERAEEIGRAHV